MATRAAPPAPNVAHRLTSFDLISRVVEGRRVGQLPPAPATAALADATSNDLSCSICLEAFAADDVVSVLVCQHVFHGN